MMTLLNKIIAGLVALFGILLYTFSLGKKVQKLNTSEQILNNVSKHKEVQERINTVYDDDIRQRVRDNYTRK